MNKNVKWALVTVIAITGMISGLAIKRHRAATTLASSVFKFDPEHGFVIPLPQKSFRFMGLPMFLAISAGFGAQAGPAIEDLNRASKALSVLSQCIEIAERRLVEFDKQHVITVGDIQNPHVWIDSEDEDNSRWTIAIEAKDNDGYAWHIEFKGAEFHDIWAGS